MKWYISLDNYWLCKYMNILLLVRYAVYISNYTTMTNLYIYSLACAFVVVVFYFKYNTPKALRENLAQFNIFNFLTVWLSSKLSKFELWKARSIQSESILETNITQITFGTRLLILLHFIYFVLYYDYSKRFENSTNWDN